MILPNFLIIGSAKAGTTSLHYYLNQHPEIYMTAVKEPRFFALEGETLNFNGPDKDIINSTSITTYEEYLALFDGVSCEKAIGETSPLYLYSAKALQRIQHYLPSVKLIAILRNPADRAFSCYTHLLREGYEPLSFEDSLKAEEDRIRDNWAHLWHYTKAGFYYEQLKPYFDSFEKKNIKVYLYDQLASDPMGLLKDIFSYLKVDENFEPDLTQKNISGLPKNRLLHSALNRRSGLRSAFKAVVPEGIRKGLSKELQSWNLKDKPRITDENYHLLASLYREDILKLQNLIGEDLSAWLAPSSINPVS
ncbi:MAG: sulfotransferase [Cyanobacteria bacterium P01_D01_bin.1]